MRVQTDQHWSTVRRLVEQIRLLPRIEVKPVHEEEKEGADMLNSIIAVGEASGDCHVQSVKRARFVGKLEHHLLRDSHRRFREWIVNSPRTGAGALHTVGMPRISGTLARSFLFLVRTERNP